MTLKIILKEILVAGAAGFLLAKMVCNFIEAVGKPIKKNLDWHGCDSICHPRE